MNRPGTVKKRLATASALAQARRIRPRPGFFGGFLFPSILHEDPRYYRQGSGPITHRFAHALIRLVVTYKDSGGRTFNWCGLLGNLTASGLSNAYYPEQNRGVGKIFSRFAMGIPFSMIDHLVDEFGPDLQRMVIHKKKSPAEWPTLRWFSEK